MKGITATLVGIGLCFTTASGQEAKLGKPVAGGSNAAPASLGKPVSADWTPVRSHAATTPALRVPALPSADGSIQPVSASTASLGTPSTVIRGQSPDPLASEIMQSTWTKRGLSVQSWDGACCGQGSPLTCCDNCCWGNEIRGPGGCFYGSAEYLYWCIRDANTPPLVTTSIIPGQPADVAGRLGQPGTVVIIGGEEVGFDAASGGRFTLGYWFDCERLCGIEASYFFLSSQTVDMAAASPGAPTLVFPYFLTNPIGNLGIGEHGVIIATPDPNFGPCQGRVAVNMTSSLWGAELNLRRNLCYGSTKHCIGYHWDMLLGVRHLNLDENLSITETDVCMPGEGGSEHHIINDRFDTRNQFYGAQIGTEMEFRCCRWFLNLRQKIAFGVNEEQVDINGNTTTFAGGGATFAPGGIFALTPNIGSHDRSVFSVVPEFGLNIGYQMSDHCRIFAGYTFLYWSNVVRPGDQIERGLNGNLIPKLNTGSRAGPLRPEYLKFNEDEFWAHGLNVGFELRY